MLIGSNSAANQNCAIKKEVDQAAWAVGVGFAGAEVAGTEVEEAGVSAGLLGEEDSGAAGVVGASGLLSAGFAELLPSFFLASR